MGSGETEKEERRKKIVRRRGHEGGKPGGSMKKEKKEERKERKFYAGKAKRSSIQPSRSWGSIEGALVRNDMIGCGSSC